MKQSLQRETSLLIDGGRNRRHDGILKALSAIDRTQRRLAMSKTTQSIASVTFGLAAIFLLTATANAQSSLFPGNGGFTGGLQSGGGRGGTGQAQGLGGFGQGLGNGRTAQPGLGQQSGNGFGAGLSNAINNSPGGFVGRNFAAQNFVGLQNAAAQGGPGSSGQGNRFNGGGGFGQFGNRGQFGQQGFPANGQSGGFGNQASNGLTGQAPNLRPQQKVAFDYPTAPPAQVGSELKARFEKLSSRNPNLKEVVVLAGSAGLVRLEGTVPKAADARLAEQLVRLQPGVRQVVNEIEYPEVVGE
jgi:BON domain